jgi:dolichyl-phosphate-mannose-protein mannosyltransferase
VPFAINDNSDDLFAMVARLTVGTIDYNLHGLVNATHPYASPWWSWPLDQVPLSIYYWQDAKAYLSTSIALLGNPLIYWATWPTIILLTYRLYVSRSKIFIHPGLAGHYPEPAFFLLLMIIAQYFPYAAVTRISFIYYFYSVSPFLILGISAQLDRFIDERNYCKLVYFYTAAAIGLFVLFFPCLAGVTVPRSYTLSLLQWFRGWNF